MSTQSVLAVTPRSRHFLTADSLKHIYCDELVEINLLFLINYNYCMSKFLLEKNRWYCIMKFDKVFQYQLSFIYMQHRNYIKRTFSIQWNCRFATVSHICVSTNEMALPQLWNSWIAEVIAEVSSTTNQFLLWGQIGLWILYWLFVD